MTCVDCVVDCVHPFVCALAYGVCAHAHKAGFVCAYVRVCARVRVRPCVCVQDLGEVDLHTSGDGGDVVPTRVDVMTPDGLLKLRCVRVRVKWCVT